MPVHLEPEFAKLTMRGHGEYLGQYESEHGQAFAKLFRKGAYLRAYLWYKQGMEPGQFTDEYLTDLEREAQERGLKLKILHVVN